MHNQQSGLEFKVEKNMIAIDGMPRSGKSALAAMLALRLGCENGNVVIANGNIFPKFSVYSRDFHDLIFDFKTEKGLKEGLLTLKRNQEHIYSSYSKSSSVDKNKLEILNFVSKTIGSAVDFAFSTKFSGLETRKHAAMAYISSVFMSHSNGALDDFIFNGHFLVVDSWVFDYMLFNYLHASEPMQPNFGGSGYILDQTENHSESGFGLDELSSLVNGFNMPSLQIVLLPKAGQDHGQRTSEIKHPSNYGMNYPRHDIWQSTEYTRRHILDVGSFINSQGIEISYLDAPLFPGEGLKATTETEFVKGLVNRVFPYYMSLESAVRKAAEDGIINIKVPSEQKENDLKEMLLSDKSLSFIWENMGRRIEDYISEYCLGNGQ